MFGIDRDGRLSFVTEEFATLLSMAPGALQGRQLTSLLPADDAETVMRELRAVQETDDRQTGRCQVVFDLGDRQVPATIELTAADGAVVCSVHRSTSVHDRFDRLFDLIQDPAVAFEIVDREPLVHAVNTPFAETFGYDPADIVGESLNEFIVPEQKDEEAMDYDQRTADGKANHAIVARKTVDGWREFDYHSVPYQADDGRQYGFAIYTDVTEDRRRQQRLRVLHRVLRHNLRNDLSVVIGAAQHLNSAATDSYTITMTERILDAAGRLDAVSQQAKEVESALENTTERPIDPGSLARSVTEDYPETVTVHPSIRPSVAVPGGPGLYDALDNLVENAVEHTPEGTAVRLVVEEEGDEVLLKVTDDGPGIPAIERAAVFDGETITTLQHGSGLGIWLARWVAESAGGALSYDRTAGWTVVTIRLPAVAADSADILDLDAGESESETLPE
ncbi:PAS domain-containing sensor histidine kinase [Haloarcula halophila]|uniref:PAS domain-containing sensor histidine kinase n=1 Tax=Haloarcula TaxID=2237 RepID=UPI0023E442D4|nr:PAS domain-containing protein [Halomicroarcula sp. DFY41]